MGVRTLDASAEVWWRQAAHDLQAAQANLATGMFDVALLMAQQAVEKALKALYIAKLGQTPPRIHDIERLSRAVGVESDLHEQVFDLTDWYLEGRYPDLADRPAFEKATEEIARDMLAHVDAALQKIRSELDAAGNLPAS